MYTPLTIIVITFCFAMSFPVFAQMTEEQKEDEKLEYEKRMERMAYAIRGLDANNDTVVEHSVFLLELIGEEATPYLIREMSDRGNRKKKRVNIIYALGRMKDNARGAVPVLMPFLRHLDEEYRGAATFALGRIGPSAAKAVPSIIKRLKDPSSWVRRGAEFSLLNIATPEAKEAVRKYRASVKQKKKDFSRAAVMRNKKGSR